MLLKLEKKVTDKLTFVNEHKPVSLSVCSNVPGYTNPKCIVNEDENELLDDFLDYLTQIGERAQAEYLEENQEVKKKHSMLLIWMNVVKT